MEFELIEEPSPGVLEEDDERLPADLPVLNGWRAFSPQDRPLEDQAVWIPEQEDG